MIADLYSAEQNWTKWTVHVHTHASLSAQFQNLFRQLRTITDFWHCFSSLLYTLLNYHYHHTTVQVYLTIKKVLFPPNEIVHFVTSSVLKIIGSRNKLNTWHRFLFSTWLHQNKLIGNRTHHKCKMFVVSFKFPCCWNKRVGFAPYFG